MQVQDNYFCIQGKENKQTFSKQSGLISGSMSFSTAKLTKVIVLFYLTVELGCTIKKANCYVHVLFVAILLLKMLSILPTSCLMYPLTVLPRVPNIKIQRKIPNFIL